MQFTTGKAGNFEIKMIFADNRMELGGKIYNWTEPLLSQEFVYIKPSIVVSQKSSLFNIVIV